MHKLILLCFSVLLANSPAFSQSKTDQILKSPTAAKSGETFVYVEQMPEPSFNLSEYLSNAIVYPKDAQAKNIEGRVVVGFIVRKTGNVDSVVVTKPVYPSLDSTAVSVVKKMPRWKPGVSDGKAVDVYYTLPIKFKLVGGPKNSGSLFR